ncbi:myosin-10-like [Neocloeon triangulifer]|uniref:myosin-10-like n=1 Tax=Neocloeon triangulifer TaxID=2078957 RepID=UPI00286F543A|nr:myosin-10-like [Neocloeon triangulifer]
MYDQLSTALKGHLWNIKMIEYLPLAVLFAFCRTVTFISIMKSREAIYPSWKSAMRVTSFLATIYNPGVFVDAAMFILRIDEGIEMLTLGTMQTIVFISSLEAARGRPFLDELLTKFALIIDAVFWMQPKKVEEMSVAELQREMQARKEQIAEWSALVANFGGRLASLDDQHDRLAEEEARLQHQVGLKKSTLQEAKAALTQVDRQVEEARGRVERSSALRVEKEREAGTLKSALDNLIAAEVALQRDAAAKRAALAAEFEPRHASRQATERLLADDTLATRHETEQLREAIDTLRGKAQAHVGDAQAQRKRLGGAQAQLEVLRQALNERRHELERRRSQLAADVARKERALRDSDRELRDKIHALAEVNSDLGRVDADLAAALDANRALVGPTQAERKQIQELERSLVEIEEKRQTEAARLARVAAELEEAKLQFQRKSNELAEQTQQQQHDSLEYLSHLEGELGEVAADEERARVAEKPRRKPDPERQHLQEQIDAAILELEALKVEHSREAEEAREAHVRRLARVEVENARLSGEQRCLQLDQALRAKQAAFERQRADAELRLSEAHGRLAALQAAASAHLAQVDPALWKTRGDDPHFEQALNKMVKQQELSTQQLEARMRLVGQQKAAADRQVATLSGNCENMRRQLEHLRQSKARANNRSTN